MISSQASQGVSFWKHIKELSTSETVVTSGPISCGQGEGIGSLSRQNGY